MRRVPVVFSIDRNVVTPFVVCVTSLLKHADPDTFYELFVLYNAGAIDPQVCNEARRVELLSEICSLTFVDVGDVFAADGAEPRAAVTGCYRLLLPDLFPTYGRMIHADVEMIFRSDLADLYESACAGDELVAGVREWNEFREDGAAKRRRAYLNSIGCDPATYVNGGFLVMNLEAMRREGIMARFMEQVSRPYDCPGENIINVVCHGRIELLPMRWNYTWTHYQWAHTGTAAYREAHWHEIDEAEWRGTIHYTGPKPWEGFCQLYDCWWASYRESAAFDADRCYREQEVICRLQEAARSGPQPSGWKRLWHRVGRAFGFKKA